MTAGVHPTAIVASDACLGRDVEIGPFAIVGEGCQIGDGCVLAARVTLERGVRLGANVRVGIGSVLGGDPQDLKYRGEETIVEIGSNTIIREYVTINRGTKESLRTSVGRDCLIMSYVHVAHDCHIGEGVIISNASQFAGHVTVEDRASISGVCAFHQFVRIGTFSFVGGMSRVTKDIPPYLRAVGNPVRLFGLNSVGLQRNNFDPVVIREIKHAYRLLFRSELNVTQALERAHAEVEPFPEVRHLLAFVDSSQRGVGF